MGVGIRTLRQKSMYLSCEQFPTQTIAERHLEVFVLKLNSDNPALAIHDATFGTVIDRFVHDEKLLERSIGLATGVITN